MEQNLNVPQESRGRVFDDRTTLFRFLKAPGVQKSFPNRSKIAPMRVLAPLGGSFGYVGLLAVSCSSLGAFWVLLGRQTPPNRNMVIMEREAHEQKDAQARQARQKQLEQQEEREPDREHQDEQQGKCGESSESMSLSLILSWLSCGLFSPHATCNPLLPGCPGCARILKGLGRSPQIGSNLCGSRRCALEPRGNARTQGLQNA